MTAGFGHDFALHAKAGLTLSVEAGLSISSQTVQFASATSTEPLFLLAGRAAAAVYVEPTVSLRLFVGASLGTGLWNDWNSLRTNRCLVVAPVCDSTETGRTTLTAVGQAGAGLRWQIVPGVSVILEGWMPLTSVANQLPFSVVAGLRLGTFSSERRNSPSPPRSPPADPPPPIIPL
ncbi:MAG: hypothetical protein AMXMBFR34_13270 [Myxococcaceae bacterium]